MKSTTTNMAVDTNPGTAPNTSAGLHPNQGSVAVELGLDVTKFRSAVEAVEAIESALGKSAEEECARWFAISALRYLRKEKWAAPNDSGLDDERQNSLARDCLAVEGFSSSLRTVTKDARSKFRLVNFASSKKIERGVLATGTKAYKIAAHVIVEAGLVEQKEKKASNKTKSEPKTEPKTEPKKKSQRPELKEIEKTVVGRRAKRRGYSEDEIVKVVGVSEVPSDKNQALPMSKEEFADLDAALSKSDTEIIQQSWGDQQNEDRWSRILGLLAGVGFFVFIALLFL